MVPLAGVPFPYDPASMPPCPPELFGTWIKSSYDKYWNEGNVAKVKSLIDIAVSFKNERDVALYCGEFGVYIPNSDIEDRVYWYDVVRRYLEEKGLAWTIWDYMGGFGLFEAGTNELFECDLNIPLVEALGLNVPPQRDFILESDTTGFDLYRDYVGSNIVESSWIGNGVLQYYSENNPLAGTHCIYWSEVDQYCHIGFKFKPIKDLSVLVNDGYAIDFWVRGDSPGTKFDIRFVDTKTDDPNDHPWRMRMTIDETMTIWNGEWNHLQIPLSEFTEHGSWDNGWFNPQGDFDWMAVEYFEIVAEQHALENIKFWFDNISAVDPRTVNIQDDVQMLKTFELYQNYPNPFNSGTAISFELSANSKVKLAVYDVLGKEIDVLVDEYQNPGSYTAHFDASGLASGIYVFRLIAGDFVQTRKMVYSK